MGCSSSKSSSKKKDKEDPMKIVSQVSGREMLHTNSMLFSSEVMEDARKSISAMSLKSASDWETSDENPVFTSADTGYELGMEIVYAKDMEKTMSISQSLSDIEKRKIKFGYTSIAGRASHGPNKPNQDSLVVFRIDGHPDQVVFGVFDGHGPFGQFASHFCRMELHKTMLEIYQEKPTATPETLLHESIQRIHVAFNNSDPSKNGVDPQVSGTTLVVALVVQNKVYVANVGDSRCVMGIRSSETDVKAKVVAMSDDHKPERPSELARISKTEAVMLTEGHLRGGSKDGKTYVCRRDSKGNIVYGVLFSRSIGDFDAHKYLGIESKAEIVKGTIDPSANQYLVIASDGVWDQLSNEQVMRKVFHLKDPLSSSRSIANASRDLWDNDRLHSRRDDITVVVVQLA